MTEDRRKGSVLHLHSGPRSVGYSQKAQGRRTDLQSWENGRSCADSGVCDGFHQLRR